MSTQKFAMPTAHSEFERTIAPGQHQTLDEANPSRYSPSTLTINVLKTDPTVHAARWARLKDHLADIASLMPAERNNAIELLQLEEDDRRWLKVLAKPLLTDDPRL